nr:unnamed protein product [Callosobruchus chinensis]
MRAAVPRKISLSGRKIRTTHLRTEVSAQSAEVSRHRELCSHQ